MKRHYEVSPEHPVQAPVGQSGQGLTEYIMLLMLIAVASLTVTQTLGKQVKSKIEQARQKIDQALNVD